MQVDLLGPLRARHDGDDVRLGGPKPRAVFAMLALTPGRVVSVDHLVDGLWTEDELPGKPTATLQVYVHGLRRALKDIGAGDVVVTRPPGYLMVVDTADVDLHRFERGWATAREQAAAGDPRAAHETLSTALSLWRGAALADLRDFPFAQAVSARLDEARLAATEDDMDLQLACGWHDRVVGTLEELVAAHPNREKLWGQLMIALYRCNRQADALAAYTRARDRLADELGIDPSEALQQLELAILRHDDALGSPPTLGLAETRAEPTQTRALRPRPEARLPVVLTATVGRDALVNEIIDLLENADCRLISLLGPGGSGKTRVATVTAEAVRRFEGGVYFIAAADLDDGTAVLTRTLHAIGGHEPAGHDGLADEIGAALPDAPTLIVLDNLEQVDGAATAVAQLLASAPQVSLIVTSRMPLRLQSETEIVVPPLEVPPSTANSRELGLYPAVSLLLDRARQVRRSFEVTEENAADVVRLCRLLGGLPLAIELAAARLKVIDVAQIVARIGDDLSLLSSSAHDLPERQRRLTSVITWSLEHLSEPALELLARLAVFEDGFGLEEVEDVAAIGGDDPDDPIDSLSQSMEAGLIRLQQSRVALRYEVLGPVRAHLLSQRTCAPEIAARIREGHLQRLVERALEWSPLLDGPSGEVTLARFDDEQADIHALIVWALTTDRRADAIRLALAAHGYWRVSGRLIEASAILGRINVHGLDAATRARLRLAQARIAYQQDDRDAAATACQAAIEDAEAAPDVLPGALAYLAAVQVGDGDVVVGAANAQRALDLISDQPDSSVQLVALAALAIASAISGDFAAERRYHEERLAVVRARGDQAGIADTLNTLAEIALDTPDVELARSYADEALRLAGGHRPMERCDALITSARAAVLADDLAQAAHFLAEAISLTERTGQSIGRAQALRTAAAMLVACGEHATAVRFFALAHVVSPPPGGGSEPLEDDLRGALARAREHLPEADSDRAWTIGSSLGASLANVRTELDGVLSRFAADTGSELTPN